MKKTIIKYAISVTVSCAFVVLFLLINNFSFSLEPVTKYRLLADAFTVVGSFMVLLSALVWVSTTGFFDGIAYAFKHLFVMLIPGVKGKDEKYYDYKTRMEGKRIKGYSFVLFTGLLHMVVAGIFIILFYSVFGK